MSQKRTRMRRLLNYSVNSRIGYKAILAIAVLAPLFLQSTTMHAQTVVTTNTATALKQALQGGGTVTLNFNNSISLTNPITINKDVVLDAAGNSVTISGNGTSQLFIVPSNITFTIKNLTMANGKVTGLNGGPGSKGANDSSNEGKTGGPGGAGLEGRGGAIFNQGVLEIYNCNFSSNNATGGNGGVGGTGGNGGFRGGNGGTGGNGGIGQGGAVFNAAGASVLLSNCNFSANLVIGGNGGAGGTNGIGPLQSFPGNGGIGANGSGAAVFNRGELTVVNCAFSDNTGRGGNSATAGTSGSGDGMTGSKGGDALGGGIQNLGGAVIVNSTFFHNVLRGGTGGNGGMANWQAGNGGNGGSAIGGGIYNSITGVISVKSCTISTNLVFGGTNGIAGTGPFAGEDGTIGQALGANIANAGGSNSFTIVNSILSSAGALPNAFGSINDGGNNLSSDGSPVWAAGSNSRNNRNPLLGPFSIDNGGPTPTMELNAGSPAIDKGNIDQVLPFDQRGFDRGNPPDIGAFETGNEGFTISGRALIGTNGASDMTISIGEDTVTTDANGNFIFWNLPPGTNVVVPQFSSLFTPSNSVVIVGPSRSSINFTSTVGLTQLSVGTNSQVSILFSRTPNRDFNILASTNLTNWIVIGTNNSGINGLFEFTQPTTGFPYRFFRATIP